MSLTGNEESLIQKLGVDRDLAEALKATSGSRLRQADAWTNDYQLVPGDGVAARRPGW